MSDDATALLERHERLPTSAAAAATVMRLADDPDASAAQLAQALAPDPVLAARLLRVANSAYYGLGGRVSTLSFAVAVVGFQTVRSLAVTSVAGLSTADAAPTGFWEAAATSATAAELVAPLLGAHPGDAFSLGLLHTLGTALLHQHRPQAVVCLPQAGEGAVTCRLEQEQYGITHTEAAAHVLRAWNFPDRVCEPIARHHEALLPDCDPLERSLHTARALADRILTGAPSRDSSDEAIAWLSEGRLTPTDIAPLLARLGDRAAGLLDGLRPPK